MKRYKLNEDYFEKIDCEEKAYFLGFICADGCIIYQAKHSPRLSIEIQSKDKEILEKFNSSLNSNHIITYRKRNNNAQPTVILNISSTKLCNDLINLGCTPRKSLTLSFPELEYWLIRHFIRGYFDGDGSLMLKKIKANQKTQQFKWNLIGTYDICLKISDFFYKELKIPVRKIHKQGKCYVIYLTGKKHITKVTDYLYCNSSLFLKRKHLSSLSPKEEQRQNNTNQNTHN